MDILKVYPSGRVTASRRKKFNPAGFARRKPLTEEEEWNIGQMRAHGLDSAIASKRAHNPSIPLGLSSVANLSAGQGSVSGNDRAKRGSKGISSKSRQQIKDAATLLERTYGRDRLSFVTHTIPDEFVESTHANWVKILANLRRRYTRALKKANLPQKLVMVSEFQEDRLAKTGKAVLHLHIVFVGRHKKKSWEYKCEYYHEHWRESCEQYNSERYDRRIWNAATRVESIRKSCANYLGKYMSKGVSTLANILERDPSAFIPPSWHILTQRMRVEVRRATRHYEGKIAELLFDWLVSKAKELLRFNRYIKLPTQDGRERCVGWYGDLKEKRLFDSVAVV